ncbi:hypothetical protein FRX31_034265 [Thalictrum thalictroides]|uniref:Uncharacterized protein n=1 Tax=Thalictrum thalictroides TaxID=46969 RepID=A0A7J6UUA8_THATH|nr:hypothetical protein FRX31_034265 [Thalictrum thalictroides]
MGKNLYFLAIHYKYSRSHYSIQTGKHCSLPKSNQATSPSEQRTSNIGTIHLAEITPVILQDLIARS